MFGEKTASLAVKKKNQNKFYFHISYYRIFKCIIALIPPTAKDTGLAEEVRGKIQDAEQVHETFS